MRTIGNHLLNKTAAATRPGYTDTGQGGDTVAYIVNATNPTFRLRIHAATGKEIVQAEREDQQVTHVGYCKPGIDVVRDDVLIIGGFRYDVIMVLPPSLEHHLKFLIQEIRPDTGYKYAVSKDDGIAIMTKDADGTIKVLEVKDS